MTIATETAAAADMRPAGRPGLLRSPSAKFFLIALLCGVLLVPLMLVWALTSERSARRDEVVRTIAAEWAGPQTLTGPMLVVPYDVERTTVREGQPDAVAVERRTRVILPERFAVTADLPVERRQVSIFEATVYAATSQLSATFGRTDPASFGPGVRAIRWSEAVLALGIADLGGIEEVAITAGGATLAAEPGIGVPANDGLTGLHVPLSPGLDAAALAGGFPVEIRLRLKGAESFTVAPVGRTSEIGLASDWPHPRFAVGASLPSERSVSEEGFTATWRIPSLARNVPQAWTVETEGFARFGGTAVGADLTIPVDFYALTERALKYGLMFVGAVFGIVFVLEVLSPKRIHVVQYAIVGLILVFFYVLLLGLSEQIGFGAAYALASLATGLVVASFVGLQLASRGRALVAAAGFAVLFGLLYVLLRLEDVALLAGGVTGFLLLTVVLFATRRVDWSAGEPAGRS